MRLEEGQVYEGNISISGDEGPFHRWIVVAPFGKTHIHSLDDPLDLCCWPAALIELGIESGRLHYAGKMPDHPAIQVQRAIEAIGVRDAHLSISEDAMERLLGALADAVDADAAYAPYLAGEILCAASHSMLPRGHREHIVSRVYAVLAGAESPLPGAVAEGISESGRGWVNP